MENFEIIKEKIRKLLALASSQNNENEAAAALGKAQELMLTYKLSMADLPDNEVPHEDIICDKEPLFAAGRIHNWKSQLAVIFASHNNCRLVKYNNCKTEGNSRGTKLVIFGKLSDIDHVRYLLAYAITTLTNFANIPCMNEGHTFKQSWYLGAVSGIREKLSEATNRAMTTASTFAINKYKSELQQVDNFIADSVGKLRKGQANKNKINANAWAQGNKVGRNFDFGDAKKLGQKDRLGMR